MGRLDDMIGRVGRIAGESDLAAKVLGGLSDDPSVFTRVSRVQQHTDPVLGQEILRQAGGFTNPRPGSESGALDVGALIQKAAYPDGLGAIARRRVDYGGVQMLPDSPIPVLIRPDRVLGDGSNGAQVSIYSRATKDRLGQAIDLAAGSSDPLRTLIHESRHVTEFPGRALMKAMPSITKHSPSIDGRILKSETARYYAKPSELLAYLSEAGDEFVKDRGRLVRDLRDANAVMEMVESGSGIPSLGNASPWVSKMYSDAYKNSRTARQAMNDILTNYFAVPVAAGVASQYEESP